MRVRVLINNEPTVLDNVSLVVVEDASGTPVSIACEYGETDSEHILGVATCADPQFQRMLTANGIDKTVIVTHDTADTADV